MTFPRGPARHAEWDEAKHPRAEDGKFGGGGGGGAKDPGPGPARGGSPFPATAERPRFDGEAFAARAEAAREANRGRYTPEHTAAVGDYVKDEAEGGGNVATYQIMNNLARGRPPLTADEEPLRAKMEARVKALADAIEATEPFEEPVTVYRGLNLKTEKAKASFMTSIARAAETGEPIMMGGFVSGSAKPGVALGFTSGEEEESVLFEIVARKGLMPDSVMSGTYGECEVIMAPGSRFKVHGVADAVFPPSRPGWPGTKWRVVQIEQVIE